MASIADARMATFNAVSLYDFSVGAAETAHWSPATSPQAKLTTSSGRSKWPVAGASRVIAWVVTPVDLGGQAADTITLQLMLDGVEQASVEFAGDDPLDDPVIVPVSQFDVANLQELEFRVSHDAIASRAIALVCGLQVRGAGVI